MASDSEASCVSDPNFAVICGFLEKFGASCGITSPDFLELQEMLENTQELSPELIDIHVKLLRKVRRSVSSDRWERVLIKLCHTYSSQDAWELERFGYKKARLSSKLRILKQLLEMQFDFNQKFKAEVNRLTSRELRTEPIGRDKHGHSYWYQIDEHCQLRVYREDPDEETWELVAKDRDGLVRLISQLASNDPSLGDLALNEDSNSLEIEKPITDTGQTSSSASNCEAEVDESSAGNEDSKEEIASDQKTDISDSQSPIKNENKTETTDSSSNSSNGLEIVLSTTSETTHKMETVEPPESKISIKTDEKKPSIVEIPIENKIDVVKNVPLSAMSKGMDLSNKRKKSINELAANLINKNQDLLHKNPIQEQEIDLSLKKKRIELKQFSSLSEPPFEPISSIESALGMSTEFLNSDEEDEDDYESDEIELPSHMTQPRLVRPTLLGNAKKKTYSDEEEYGEEIEEPLMLIQGEGSGRDCENENIKHTNTEFSEAIEESVIFFYGEGSGHDCNTGNTSKEADNTNPNKSEQDRVKSENPDKTDLKSASANDLKTSTDGVVSVTKDSSEVSKETLTEKCKDDPKVSVQTADTDSIDNKSELDQINADKSELSPKCHKVGKIIIDVKTTDRNQSAEISPVKKTSRWDVGKPGDRISFIADKPDDFKILDTTEKDSTNNSIIKCNDVKLPDVSENECSQNVSKDIKHIFHKPSITKDSNLIVQEIINEVDSKSDNNSGDKSCLDSEPATVSNYTTDNVAEQSTKKQNMFFFGPGCFQFKTPAPSTSAEVKDARKKSCEKESRKEQLDIVDKEIVATELSSNSVNVPTCVNKADILLNIEEQNKIVSEGIVPKIEVNIRIMNNSESNDITELNKLDAKSEGEQLVNEIILESNLKSTDTTSTIVKTESSIKISVDSSTEKSKISLEKIESKERQNIGTTDSTLQINEECDTDTISSSVSKDKIINEEIKISENVEICQDGSTSKDNITSSIPGNSNKVENKLDDTNTGSECKGNVVQEPLISIQEVNLKASKEIINEDHNNTSKIETKVEKNIMSNEKNLDLKSNKSSSKYVSEESPTTSISEKPTSSILIESKTLELTNKNKIIKPVAADVKNVISSNIESESVLTLEIENIKKQPEDEKSDFDINELKGTSNIEVKVVELKNESARSITSKDFIEDEQTKAEEFDTINESTESSINFEKPNINIQNSETIHNKDTDLKENTSKLGTELIGNKSDNLNLSDEIQNDDNVDDKSETLSETLESLSTLIENESDEQEENYVSTGKEDNKNSSTTDQKPLDVMNIVSKKNIETCEEDKDKVIDNKKEKSTSVDNVETRQVEDTKSVEIENINTNVVQSDSDKTEPKAVEIKSSEIEQDIKSNENIKGSIEESVISSDESINQNNEVKLDTIEKDNVKESVSIDQTQIAEISSSEKDKLEANSSKIDIITENVNITTLNKETVAPTSEPAQVEITDDGKNVQENTVKNPKVICVDNIIEEEKSVVLSDEIESTKIKKIEECTKNIKESLVIGTDKKSDNTDDHKLIEKSLDLSIDMKSVINYVPGNDIQQCISTSLEEDKTEKVIEKPEDLSEKSRDVYEKSEDLLKKSEITLAIGQKDSLLEVNVQESISTCSDNVYVLTKSKESTSKKKVSKNIETDSDSKISVNIEPSSTYSERISKFKSQDTIVKCIDLSVKNESLDDVKIATSKNDKETEISVFNENIKDNLKEKPEDLSEKNKSSGDLKLTRHKNYKDEAEISSSNKNFDDNLMIKSEEKIEKAEDLSLKNESSSDVKKTTSKNYIEDAEISSSNKNFDDNLLEKSQENIERAEDLSLKQDSTEPAKMTTTKNIKEETDISSSNMNSEDNLMKKTQDFHEKSKKLLEFADKPEDLSENADKLQSLSENVDKPEDLSKMKDISQKDVKRNIEKSDDLPEKIIKSVLQVKIESENFEKDVQDKTENLSQEKIKNSQALSEKTTDIKISKLISSKDSETICSSKSSTLNEDSQVDIISLGDVKTINDEQPVSEQKSNEENESEKSESTNDLKISSHEIGNIESKTFIDSKSILTKEEKSREENKPEINVSVKKVNTLENEFTEPIAIGFDRNIEFIEKESKTEKKISTVTLAIKESKSTSLDTVQHAVEKEKSIKIDIDKPETICTDSIQLRESNINDIKKPVPKSSDKKSEPVQKNITSIDAENDQLPEITNSSTNKIEPQIKKSDKEVIHNQENKVEENIILDSHSDIKSSECKGPDKLESDIKPSKHFAGKTKHLSDTRPDIESKKEDSNCELDSEATEVSIDKIDNKVSIEKDEIIVQKVNKSKLENILNVKEDLIHVKQVEIHSNKMIKNIEDSVTSDQENVTNLEKQIKHKEIEKKIKESKVTKEVKKSENCTIISDKNFNETQSNSDEELKDRKLAVNIQNVRNKSEERIDIFDIIKVTGDQAKVPLDKITTKLESSKITSSKTNEAEMNDSSSDDGQMDSSAFEQDIDYIENSDIEENNEGLKNKEIPVSSKSNYSKTTKDKKGFDVIAKNNTIQLDTEKITTNKIIDTENQTSNIVTKGKEKSVDKIDMKSSIKQKNKGKTPVEEQQSKLLDLKNIEIVDKPETKISEMKIDEIVITERKPKLICVDISKLQEKSPTKPENKTIVELKHQSDISSHSLESVGIDNEESSDIIDVPETDPLACSDEELLLSKRIEETIPSQPQGLSLATFKLDCPDTNSSLLPEPIARALRNRKVSVDAVATTARSTRKRGRSIDNEEVVGKRKRTRGRRSTEEKNTAVKDASSSDEEHNAPLQIDFPPQLSPKVTTPQRGTGKARRGRGRGRGRGITQPIRTTNESPVLSDAQSEPSQSEIVETLPEKIIPKKVRKKRRVLGLDIDPSAIIPTAAKTTENEELITRGSIRQSRRIAQIKIKEEAERRKVEEFSLIDITEHKKKKNKKDEDKDYKVDGKKKKSKLVSEDEEESEEEVISSSKKKHKKKRKHQDLKKLFNIANPWQSSSGSSTSHEEEEEEEVEEEPTEDEAVLKSDHEFSPESDLENNFEAQPLRRARTVKKESDTEEPTDEHACQKCSKADHPEWILLCDKCDCGWHCSCLKPALLVIPEGDWFCPPCQHISLVEALKVQLIEFDKKMNRKEMEVRRKQRLAYVGISLDNVLPAKDQEGAREQGEEIVQEEGFGSEGSSDSGSSSGSSSGDESEPIYQLRERRQAHSYRFNDYDELINSAIQEEIEAVKGAGNQGRGKDIATIVNAEKEEAKAQAMLEDKDVENPTFEPPPPVVPVYTEKPEQKAEESEEESDNDNLRVVPKHMGRKKHRKLNSLDISSEDDPDDDEDFKGTSASEEEDLEDMGSEDSDEFDGRRGRRGSGPIRRSGRARTTRFDREFINDDTDEDVAPRRKKIRSIWDESESEESDKSWGKAKRIKKQRQSSTPRSSKKSRKKKKRRDDSDPEAYTNRKAKKPKIKFGGLDDSDDDELLTRRTRGKKINYIDALGSDTEEEKPTTKRLDSEDEYVANEEEDEEQEDVIDAVDDDKGSNSDSVIDKSSVIPRKVIKIIKGRGKGGIPRPQNLTVSSVAPVLQRTLDPEETNEEIDDEEDEDDYDDEEEEDEETTISDNIPIIAANTDDLNEEEVETMMMENEEYAKKQLELMAIQLAKEKKKKEQEAKKLPEKPAEPKKRGRKRKVDIEAAAALAAAVAADSEESFIPSITSAVNPSLIPNLNAPFIQPNITKIITPPKLELISPHSEISSIVPTVVSELSTSTPKRRGRGKGKKTLAAEAKTTTPTSESMPSSASTTPDSAKSVSVSGTIIPPTTSIVSSAPNLPLSNILVHSAPLNEPNVNIPPDSGILAGKLGIAAPPQPFSQSQPTPSVITRMLQSQPISAQTFTSAANSMNQKYFPGMPMDQPPRGAPPGQFSPMGARGRVPSPYRQSPPVMNMFPGLRPGPPNSPHRLRSPGPPNMQQLFHSSHHPMDPSPSGGGPINISPVNRDRNSPAIVPPVSSPLTSKDGPTPPPPPPYNRATMAINRFSASETSPGPSLPPPIRHHLFPQSGTHMQQPSPPPRPPPPGNFSPYHPPPPPNYHYGAYPPAPTLAAADDALPPTDYQGSPYPEHYNTTEATVHSSEGSNSKPFDEEGSGEFGGLVSYFSSQREDDLDT